MADEYEETMERYMRYQDYLFAQGKLEGYEKKMYLRRRRQSLLWKLLLDDAIESLPAVPRANPERELERRGRRGDRRRAARYAAEEMARVLELGALVREPAPEGVRFAWTE